MFPDPVEHDGDTPPRYCTCGCGIPIGDANWTVYGIRTCTQLRALRWPRGRRR